MSFVQTSSPTAFSSNLRANLAPHREVLGGFFGGACGIFATHPLDTIRVRAQVATGTKNASYLRIVRDIVKHRGVLGLYAGVFPPVFLRGIGFSMNRWAYSFTKQFTDNSAILGASAGFFNAIADTPIFCLKNRVQCSNGQFKESLSYYMRMGWHILRTEGIRGLFTGHVPNMYCEVISYALFYLVYDHMNENLGYAPWICGVSAVLACWPSVYPLDVMRTRSQVSAVLACWPSVYPLDVMRTRSQVIQKRTKWSRDYFTFRYFLREMWKQPVRRWFPGMGMTLVRAAPRYGVAMTVCETVKNKLED